MNKILGCAFLLLLIFVSFLWGTATIKYEVFPYLQLRYLAQAGGLLASDEEVSPKVVARIAMFDLFSRTADIVMVGDSITANGEWQDIFEDTRIANRGIGGDTTDKILKRMDGIISVSPQKAFIMVGINDLYKGLTVESVFERYTQIVEHLKENGAMVFIQSTLDCSRKGCPREEIKRLNDLLDAFSKKNGIEFIDINEKLSNIDKGLDSRYTYDGIHLNADGYRIWSSILDNHI